MDRPNLQVERPLLAAISTGRCNTLLENHCLAKMFLNQRNSYRFKGTPSIYRWRYWLPCPTDSPIACLDRGSRANRLFEISVRSSVPLAAPALQMRLQNPLARKPGSAITSGCCVDPLRPPPKADAECFLSADRLRRQYWCELILSTALSAWISVESGKEQNPEPVCRSLRN